MHHSVVAKMCVSAVNANAPIGADYTGVYAHLNCVYSPDPTAENYSFSKATPNGNARVYYRKDDQSFGFDFEAGQFYRLYFERYPWQQGDDLPDPQDQSLLRCSVQSGESGGEPSHSVTLASPNWSGGPSMETFQVSLTINNPAALGYFEPGGIYRLKFELTTKDGT